MKQYISLPRGINVSGQKKIQMADLILLYESLDFTNVKTYIQSGNVVFCSSLNSEKDASVLYMDPDLVDHLSAVPYTIFEPELVFLVTPNNEPSYYILDTKNSQDLYQQCESNWFHLLRMSYPFLDNDDTSFEEKIIRRNHSDHIVKEELLNYPRHLYIVLLPNLLRKEFGKKIHDSKLGKKHCYNESYLIDEVY